MRKTLVCVSVLPHQRINYFSDDTKSKNSPIHHHINGFCNNSVHWGQFTKQHTPSHYQGLVVTSFHTLQQHPLETVDRLYGQVFLFLFIFGCNCSCNIFTYFVLDENEQWKENKVTNILKKRTTTCAQEPNVPQVCTERNLQKENFFLGHLFK